MDTHYYIQLTMQTDQGQEPFGRLDIGEDREAALAVWELLKGDPALGKNYMLQMDWIEADINLPVEVKVKGCTLQELGENCGLIAREVFKARNLEGGGYPGL